MEKCRRLQEYMRGKGCGGIIQCRKRPVPRSKSEGKGDGPGIKCNAKAVARCG
jgi:hypothetical protein